MIEKEKAGSITIGASFQIHYNLCRIVHCAVASNRSLINTDTKVGRICNDRFGEREIHFRNLPCALVYCSNNNTLRKRNCTALDCCTTRKTKRLKHAGNYSCSLCFIK